MRVMKFIVILAVQITISTFAVGQASAESTTIKHVAITNTRADSGKEMYHSYCAVCHGADAKGKGPAASALKAVPSDLTVLAQKNSGKYPAAHVATVIRGQAALPSHGTQDMPIWGPLFSSISQGQEGQVQQRVANLVSYIETQQTK